MWVMGIAGLLAAGGAGTYAAERVNVNRRTVNALADGYSKTLTCLLAGMTLPKALGEQEHGFFVEVADSLKKGEAIAGAWAKATPPLPRDFALIWKAAGESLAWPGPEYFVKVQNADAAVQAALKKWEEQNHKRGTLWLKLGWLGGAALMCLLW